jgi:mono/diheme cytochrome c family protein
MRDPSKTQQPILLPARRVVICLTFLAGTAVLFTRGISAPRAAEPTAPAFATDVKPLLESHCIKCHGAKKQNGGVDFSKIDNDKSILRARKVWRKAIAQIESSEMPPKDAKQFEPAQRELLLTWLRKAASTVDTSDAARDPGPAVIRRLSLAEYNNTVRDLLGVQIDVGEAVGITDESGEGNTFGNLAAALDVPPALMEKYFLAADKVLDRFFGTELSSHVDGNIQDRARMARERLFLQRQGALRNPATPIKPPEKMTERDAAKQIIPNFLRRAFRRPATDAEVERFLALYDKGIEKNAGYAGAIRLVLKAALVSPHFLFRIELDRPEKGAYRVNDHELACRLSYFLWSSMPDDRLMELADQGKLTAEGPSKVPTLLGGRVIGTPSVKGDLRHSLDRAFDGDAGTFFECDNPEFSWVGLDLQTPHMISQIKYAPREFAAGRVANGKFQVSNSADFSEGVVDLFTIGPKPTEGLTTQDVKPDAAYRYVRYLSPKGGQGNIAEIEVWGIAEGTVLEQETRRMLASPKARALTDNFAASWLQIRKLPSARPNTENFPEFQPDIRSAMYDETALFFDMLRQEDRSIIELLDADYTYVNEDLAKYYKLPPVTGKALRRVSLKPEDHRGGLLGMGSVLALTSHVSRTSPTLRGKYVLEVIFGTPPPPPPADAGMIKEEGQKGKEPKSFRELLGQHSSEARCASCHKRLDPLGFALDNYNAAGVWRDNDKGRPLDTTGILPTGEKLTSVADLKQVLLNRKGEFTHNMVEQMLIYSLGRELDYFDDRPVLDIQTALEKDQNRFSRLVMGIVQSYPFQYRRNADAGE